MTMKRRSIVLMLFVLPLFLTNLHRLPAGSRNRPT